MRSNRDWARPFSWARFESTVAGSCSGSPTRIIRLHPNRNGIRQSSSRHWAASSSITMPIWGFPVALSALRHSSSWFPLKFKVQIMMFAFLRMVSLDSCNRYLISTADLVLSHFYFWKTLYQFAKQNRVLAFTNTYFFQLLLKAFLFGSQIFEIRFKRCDLLLT